VEGLIFAFLKAFIELKAIPWLVVGALLLLLYLAVKFFVKELKAAQAALIEEKDKCQTERAKLYTQLIEVGTLTQSALAANTSSSSALAFSVEARMQAFTKLTETVQVLVAQGEAEKVQNESSRSYFAGWTDRTDKRFEEISRRMEAIERNSVSRHQHRNDP
jgi:hypothetical protein